MVINGDQSLIVPFSVHSKALSRVKKPPIVLNLWSLTEIQIVHIYTVYSNKVCNKIKGLTTEWNYLKKEYSIEYNSGVEVPRLKQLYERSLVYPTLGTFEGNKYGDCTVKYVHFPLLKQYMNKKVISETELSGDYLFKFCLSIYMANIVLDELATLDQIIALITEEFTGFFTRSKKLNSIHQYLVQTVKINARIDEILRSTLTSMRDSENNPYCHTYDKKLICNGESSMTRCTCLDIMQDEVQTAIEKIIFEVTLCFTIFVK